MGNNIFTALGISVIFLGTPSFAAPADSVNIGRPVTVGISTSSYNHPLDTVISIRFPEGTLRAFLEEIHRTSKLDFVITDGLDKCELAAFLNEVPTRQALQIFLEAGGFSYQQLGRSNQYTITRWKNGPLCPPVRDKVPSGKCSVGSRPLSINCRQSKLSRFAELLFDQSHANIVVWNEAVEYPVSVDLKGASLEEALKQVRADPALDIRQVGDSKDRFVFRMAKPQLSSSPESQEPVIIGRDDRRPLKRVEPSPNPDFEDKGIK